MLPALGSLVLADRYTKRRFRVGNASSCPIDVAWRIFSKGRSDVLEALKTLNVGDKVRIRAGPVDGEDPDGVEDREDLEDGFGGFGGAADAEVDGKEGEVVAILPRDELLPSDLWPYD